MSIRDVQVNLTIGRETRKVSMSAHEYLDSIELKFYGLEVTTVHGGQLHRGTARFKYTEGKTDYTIDEARDIRYHGMRGNGYARKSKFRYIGFAEV